MLAFLFIGLGNVVAQTEATTKTETDEVKKECPWTKTADGKLICTKTGKICSEACVNKSKGKCCKGKRKGCSGKSGKYNKASKKSSCSKAKKCGDDCTKPCCAKEEEPTEENDENSDE